MLLNDAMTTMPTQSRGHGTRAPGSSSQKGFVRPRKIDASPLFFPSPLFFLTPGRQGDLKSVSDLCIDG